MKKLLPLAWLRPPFIGSRRRRAALLVAFIVLIVGPTALHLGANGILLGTYHLSREKGVEHRLARSLEEISGLAMTPDGRLFAHNDERAVFYQLDPETGKVVKAFSAGPGGVAGDFEGVAIVGPRFFLMTSGGGILETEEGSPSSAMTYRLHDTGLGTQCELEGLAFNPETAAFLMPCKEPKNRDLRHYITVFSVPIQSMRPEPVPWAFIPLEDLEAFDVKPSFFPSGIEVHPETGNVLIISAREEAILELSPQGSLLDAQELRRKTHPQPEGITFLPDGSLLLADEGQGHRGRLTRYPAEAGSGGGP